MVTIDLAAVATGSKLPELYHSSDATSWDRVQDSAFDDGTKRLTGSITHFSYVAAFASGADAGSAGSGGTGSGGTGSGGTGGTGVVPVGSGGTPDSSSGAGAGGTDQGGASGCDCCCGLICFNSECVAPPTT